jgi:serine/threonine protein kinase
MELDALDRMQRIRERLFEVLTDFPILYQARQGVGSKIYNPFSSLEQVVRTHVNPLILYINDLVQEIQQGLPYLEALNSVVLFALRNKYRDRVLEAVRQLAKVEGNHPYFLRGLAWLIDAPNPAKRALTLQELHRKLHLMNHYYVERFGTEEDVDLIPWRVTFRPQTDGITEGTYEYPVPRQLEVFRQALWALIRLGREHQMNQWLHRRIRKKIQAEIAELAQLLFDHGYTVDEISGRIAQYENYLGHFLNDVLLREIESTLSPRMELRLVSRHVTILSLMDFRIMIPFRTFYRRLSETQAAIAMAREIERKENTKVSQFRRIILLHKRYQEYQQPMLAYYLEYRFSRSHGDYLPARDKKHLGIDITKKFVLRFYDNKEFEQRVEETARKVYSSKASEEMLALLRLLVQALSRPETIRGKKVSILGHIRSMVMGRILIGIFQGNLVALKERKPSKGSSMPISEEVRRLEYEARLHTYVQSGPLQHENIVECFGVVEEGDRRFLAIGYHPAETLGSLVRRAKTYAARRTPHDRPPLKIIDLKTISVQLFQVLFHLKAKQVVHRDLKPANILYLVDIDGWPSLIKVIDFGVAVRLKDAISMDIHRGHVVGTLSYMAPEMVQGRASYSTDLFSSGVILYQVMSGRLPLELKRGTRREQVNAELKRVVSEERISLLQANAWLTEVPALLGLANLVDQMIERNPDKRISLEALHTSWMDLWKNMPEEILTQPLLYAS